LRARWSGEDDVTVYMVIHLGFTGLIHLRDGLFQLFVGGNLMD
jgi:hypothetical protein